MKKCFSVFRASLLFFLASLLALGALKSLPYASCLLEPALPIHQETDPKTEFCLGSLRWDVRSYAADPTLEPFRNYFHLHSGGTTGQIAALRIASQLRRDIPFGGPSREFLNYDFDPAQVFDAHLRGEPGHCVTYSGFLATSLLSVGIPARVVQFVPNHTTLGGHNAVEVWDDQFGWCVIDPNNPGSLFLHQGPCSACQALCFPDDIRLASLEKLQSPDASPALSAPASFALHDASLIYPEPWLYLRTGVRQSHWPFRGRFVVLGDSPWNLGPAQAALRWAIAACMTGFLACVVWMAARWAMIERCPKPENAPLFVSSPPDGPRSESLFSSN